MNEEVAVENLKEIKDILDKVGVTFWLDSGVLLGAVRDGKIIEWDRDVDLGTWYDNTNKIISAFPLFKERGFQAFLSVNGVIITKGCWVTISLFRKTGDYAWLCAYAKNKKIEKILGWCMDALSQETYTKPEGKRFVRKRELFLALLPSKLRHFMADMTWSIMDRCDLIIPWVIPKRYFEKLSTIHFYGIKINIPSNIEKYFEYRYGSNWKTPNRKWKWFKDDGALNPNFKQKIVKDIRLKH
jgi:hypothetical protein